MSDKEKYEQAGRYLAENKSLDTEIEHLRAKLADHAITLDQLSKFLHSTIKYDTPPAYRPPEEPDWTTLPTAGEIRRLLDELEQKRARQAEVRENLRRLWRLGPLREHFLDQAPPYAGQPLVQPLIEIREFLMVEPHQVQDGRVQV